MACLQDHAQIYRELLGRPKPAGHFCARQTLSNATSVTDATASISHSVETTYFVISSLSVKSNILRLGCRLLLRAIRMGTVIYSIRYRAVALGRYSRPLCSKHKR